MNPSLNRSRLVSRLRIGVLGLALMLGAGSTANAQQMTEGLLTSTITAENYRVKFDNHRLSVKDLVTGRDLVKDDHSIAFIAGECDGDLKVEAKPDGVDFIITAKNETGTAKRPPCLAISRFLFSDIETWNFRHGSRKMAVQFPTFAEGASANKAILRHNYPRDAYSPVVVFSDASHSVGISIMYDAVGYDQEATVDLIATKPGPTSPGNGYFVVTSLVGKVPANSTRTYRVSVRFARQGQHWLRTLAPYRDWFRQTYGGVQYVADRRPVLGTSFADMGYISPANPRGFGFPRARPDIYGYGEIVNRTNEIISGLGYERIMVWAVSGLNQNHTLLNYPYRFATGVDTQPSLQQSANELRRLGEGGRNIGFWWGLSSQVTAPGWDTGSEEMFDPSNSSHVLAATTEMDRAVQLGATTIGLDAFVMASPGAQYRLLHMLHQRYPQVKFISEVSACDYLHTLGGTWHYGIDVSGPDFLAQFIVPGHETWAGTNASQWGHLTLAEDIAKTTQIASWGFTVLDGIGITNRLAFRGTDVSAQVVPPDLYLPPAPARTGFQANLATPPAPVTPPEPVVVPPPDPLPPPPPPLPGENPLISPVPIAPPNPIAGGTNPQAPGGSNPEFPLNLVPSEEQLAGARSGGGGGVGGAGTGGGGPTGGGGGGGSTGLTSGGGGGGSSGPGVSGTSGSGTAAGGEGSQGEPAPAPALPIRSTLPPAFLLSPEAQRRLEKKPETSTFSVPANARGNKP